ncbi:hypothetical protein RJ639_014831 [Escallonia herrerae]|uniref:Uncharacterized protein n=1 Tax=Escallonia herrerae TaxID=1293975 RepID=A0AA88VHJ9_9ASTE|nr:hypothetical protein RJ639_014831 [Escallonia herrerae]
MGSCQTSIAKGVQDVSVNAQTYYGHKGIWNFNKCSNALVMEEESYNFASTDLENMQNIARIPILQCSWPLSLIGQHISAVWTAMKQRPANGKSSVMQHVILTKAMLSAKEDMAQCTKEL